MHMTAMLKIICIKRRIKKNLMNESLKIMMKTNVHIMKEDFVIEVIHANGLIYIFNQISLLSILIFKTITFLKLNNHVLFISQDSVHMDLNAKWSI